MLLQNPVIETNPLFNTKPTQLGIGNYSDKIPELSNYLKFIGKRTALGSMIIPSSGAGANELAWEEQNMNSINSAQDVIDNHLNRDVNSTGAGYIFTPPEQELVNTELPFIPPEYKTYDESFVTPDSRVVDQGFTTPDTQFQDEGFITPSSADMTTLYNKGLLDDEVIEDGLLSEKAPPFYSKITKSIEDAKMNKASGDQWIGMINNSGVNQDELDWIGMKDFLADKKSVTKEEILDFARMNDLSTEVKEVILSDKSKGSEKLEKLGFQNESSVLSLMENIDSGTYPQVAEDFEKWVVANQNREDGDTRPLFEYRSQRDVALQGYLERKLDITKSDFQNETSHSSNKKLITEGDYTDYKEMTFALPNMDANFTDGHYKGKNIFAHTRFNTRIIDGQKTLFIEELQSDWVHKGKDEGFIGGQTDLQIRHQELIETMYEFDEVEKSVTNTEYMKLYNEFQEVAKSLDIENRDTVKKVPDLPFKNNWQDIVLKRMIRYAAENGFDAIAMTGGNIQKDRYDLSKHIDSIQVNASDKAEGKIHVVAGNEIDLHIYPNQLEEHIGKDLAKKINNDIEEKNIFKNFNFIKQEFENFSQELSKKYDVPASQNIAMYENVASISKKDIDKYTKLQKAVYEDTNGLEYKGLDLQVGGEGLGEMYDKIFNKSLKKIGKKHGAEIESKQLNDKLNMWYMNLTDSLKKQSIEAGMPIAFNKPVNPLLNYA